MSRNDDREGLDARHTTSGMPIILILFLAGGAVLFLMAVVGVVGFYFMARSEVQDAEMRAVMAEERVTVGERVTSAKKPQPDHDADRAYSREDFQTLTSGKTERQVEEALGKPARIVEKLKRRQYAPVGLHA